MILRIARNELANLFFTPVVWLLFIIFMVLCGVNLSSALDHLVIGTEKSGPESFALLGRIFLYSGFSFNDFIINLLMYVSPLLSMRVMTREYASGSIKLLYSSPVKSSTIIFGKYLALVMLSLLFCGILLVITLFVTQYVEVVNYTRLIIGLLAIFLLWCTYLAIGLFVSCLTRYQIVAGIVTMALLAAFHYCERLWQWKDGVREVTNWLCLSGRTSSLMNGLISSADIIYFLLIIALFLALAYYSIEIKRLNKKGRLYLNTKLGLILMVIVIGGVVSSKRNNVAYLDVTEHKTMTLSQTSKAALAPLVDEKISVTTYVNILSSDFSYGTPKSRLRDLSYLEEYYRYLPKWEMNYIYYYHQCDNSRLFSKNKDLSLKELAEKLCKLEHLNMKDVLTPEQIDARIDLSQENYKFVREVKYKDRRAFLRLFNDRQKFPGEAEITALLNSFLNSPMNVGVLQGHLERDMYGIQKDDMKDVLTGKYTRHALINNGFVPQEVNLKEEIPSDLVFLLIADPLLAYDDSELAIIQHYIDRGGNLIINGSTQSRTQLQPLLSRFDLSLGQDVLVELDRFGNYTQSLAHTNEFVADKLDEAIDLGRTLASLPMATTILLPEIIVSITDSTETLTQCYNYTTKGGETFDYVPVLASSDTAWLESNEESLSNRRIELFCDVTEGENKKSYQTAVALLRKVGGKEQKIMIVSSADYISNEGLMATKAKLSSTQGNGAFFKGVTRWMSNGEFPIYIKRERGSDRFFYMGLQEFNRFKIIWIGLIPLALLIFSILLLWSRKRR